MDLECSQDWQLRCLGDSSGVIYNGYTGQLNALAELPTKLLEVLAAGRMSDVVLCESIVAAYADENDRAGLRLETKLHLAALIELGAISTFAEHRSDHSRHPPASSI